MNQHTKKTAGWRKSSVCGSQGGDCVEIDLRGDGVGMRDSKDPDTPELEFTGGQWRTFLAGIQAGEFDLA